MSRKPKKVDPPTRTLDEEVRHELHHMEACFGTLNITRWDIAFTAVDNDELPIKPDLVAEIPADVFMDLMPRFEDKLKRDGMTYAEAMTDLHAQLDLWLNEMGQPNLERFDLIVEKREARWVELRRQLRLRLDAAQAEMVKTTAMINNLTKLLEGLKVKE